jgi:2-methylisocitrate lyase-like PEP mutase family enzyme
MPDPAEQAARAAAFLQLHHGDTPLLIPNPWDLGSAKLLASLGFKALATTSGGFAASLGRLDGRVTRDEALGHAEAIAAATDLPVSADLENCFADDPAGVADTIRRAIAAGLCGCSVEDYTRDPAAPIYELALAAERVAAAAEAAHSGPIHLVLTARAENHIHGIQDLEDTIARLRAYEEAGADVLFAPGLTGPEDIRRVVESVSRPLNVVTRAGLPSVAKLGALGVRRISVGQAFAYGGYGALVDAARELIDDGTYGFMDRAAAGVAAGRTAFAPDIEPRARTF